MESRGPVHGHFTNNVGTWPNQNAEEELPENLEVTKKWKQNSWHSMEKGFICEGMSSKDIQPK